MEDAQVMKEFLGSDEVKDYLSRMGDGFVTAPKEIVIETKDLAKAIFEYSTQPFEVKVVKGLQIIGAINKFHEQYDFGEKAKIIGSKIVRGIWQELVDLGTNPEMQGRFVAEAVLGLGVSRAIKGVKAIDGIVDEVLDVAKKDGLVDVLEEGVEDSAKKLGKESAEETLTSVVTKAEVCSNEVMSFVTKVEANIVKAGTDAGGGFKHYFDVDINLLKKEINLPSDFNNAKLRAKFDKHGKVFGMEGLNFNKQNAELFKQKLREHIQHPDTIAISGEYTTGGVGKVVHYYNPKTKLNVMKDMNGDFVSGWELSEKQKNCLQEIGKIGGSRQ